MEDFVRHWSRTSSSGFNFLDCHCYSQACEKESVRSGGRVRFAYLLVGGGGGLWFLSGGGWCGAFGVVWGGGAGDPSTPSGPGGGGGGGGIGGGAVARAASFPTPASGPFGFPLDTLVHGGGGGGPHGCLWRLLGTVLSNCAGTFRRTLLMMMSEMWLSRKDVSMVCVLV